MTPNRMRPRASTSWSLTPYRHVFVVWKVMTFLGSWKLMSKYSNLSRNLTGKNCVCTWCIYMNPSCCKIWKTIPRVNHIWTMILHVNQIYISASVIEGWVEFVEYQALYLLKTWKPGLTAEIAWVSILNIIKYWSQTDFLCVCE